MKRFVTLVVGIGKKELEDPIEKAIAFTGLQAEEFIIVGYGSNAALCVASSVVDRPDCILAIEMLKNHITALRDSK